MKIHNVFLIVLLMFFCLGAGIASANQYELTPFVGVDFTCHRGFGDSFRGVAADFEVGLEGIFTPTNNFGVGIQARTGIGYDGYMVDTDYSHDDMIVDEYFPWQASIGPVFYIGNSWFIAGSVTKVLDIIDHDTYLSTFEEDIDMKEKPYHIDDFDYSIETGWRTSFHGSINFRMTTNLISSYTIDKSKYNFYIGFRYFI